MCDTHNHDTNETLFNNLPNQRRMTPKDKSDIIQLMDMRANKNFFNRTNNRLESFNGKLKSVIDSFSNLQEFFEKLFVVIKCLRMERDNKALLIVQKWPSTKFSSAVEEQYFKLLTPYAFGFL